MRKDLALFALGIDPASTLPAEVTLGGLRHLWPQFVGHLAEFTEPLAVEVERDMAVLVIGVLVASKCDDVFHELEADPSFVDDLPGVDGHEITDIAVRFHAREVALA